MPRRTRRRVVGKWEQIEQGAREEELTELERELHGEKKHGGKPKHKGKHRRQRRRTKPGALDTGSSRDGASGNANNG